MFSNYQEEQRNFYNEMVQAVSSKKVSHAYLIETKGYPDFRNLIISFAKFLLCSDHYTDRQNCVTCNLCDLIDHSSESNIFLVEPDGQWIKKEQLAELKKSFKTKSLDDHPRIYIIFNADRLNKAAANSLLKFLEEPEDGIIAILVTEQKYHMLTTIVSRCQVYSLKSPVISITDFKVDESVLDFALNLERYQFQMIAYQNQSFVATKKTKEDFTLFFKNLEDLYEHVLKLKMNGDLSPLYNDFQYLFKKNDIKSLLKKVDIIHNMRKKLDYNVNLDLFMDQFIILFSGGGSVE